MLVSRLRTWVARRQSRFEAIVECPSMAGKVRCPRAEEERELDRCARCVHFVCVRPEPRGGLLRCLTTDDDPVMARTAGWSGPTLDIETRPGAARALAREHDRLLLPVVQHGMVVGVAYREALERLPVRLPVEVPWALDALATLGDAVDALAELGVPGLFVVSPERELLGVLSRADLLRLGVPADLLETVDTVTDVRIAR